MTFAVLLSAYLLSQFFRGFMAVVAGELTRDLGLNAADLGSLPAAWLIAFALAQFPIGLALDRFGARRTMAVFMSSAIVGAAWLSQAGGYLDCLGAMTLIGIGCAPILMAGFYLAARLYPMERFATISSLLIGFGSLGDPVSGFPLALAISHFGWRATMMGMAVITAACVAAVALLLRDPPSLGAPLDRAERHASFARIIALRPLWPILPLAFTNYAVILSIRGLWIAPYLGQVHGLDSAGQSVAAMLMGFALAGGALAYVPFTRLVGGAKRAVSLGMCVTALACLALGLVGWRSAGLAVAQMLAMGFCGTSYAIIMAHARTFMPAHSIGRGVTFMNFVFMGGAGSLQWLSGRFVGAAEASGLTPAATFGRLFVGFGIVLIAALWIYQFAPASTPAALSRARPGPEPESRAHASLWRRRRREAR